MAFANIPKPKGSLLCIKMVADKIHMWNSFNLQLFKSFQNRISSGRPCGPCTACRTAIWYFWIFWSFWLGFCIHSWKWLELNDNAWKPGGERQLDVIWTLGCWIFRSQSSSRLWEFGVIILYTGSNGSVSSRTTPHSHKRLGWGRWGNAWKPCLPHDIKHFRCRIDFLCGPKGFSMEPCDVDGVHNLSRLIQLPNILPIYHFQLSQSLLIPLVCSFRKQPVELEQRIEVKKAQAVFSSDNTLSSLPWFPSGIDISEQIFADWSRRCRIYKPFPVTGKGCERRVKQFLTLQTPRRVTHPSQN